MGSGASSPSTSESQVLNCKMVSCLGRGRFGAVNCYLTNDFVVDDFKVFCDKGDDNVVINWNVESGSSTDKKRLFAGKVYSKEQFLAHSNLIAREISVLKILSLDNLENENNDNADSNGISPYVIEYLGKYRDTQTETVFVFMDVALGGSLDRHIAHCLPHGHFDLMDSMNYFVEIVSGLRFITQRCCLHRDIKANNIILTSTGHIKIADFGYSICLHTPAMDNICKLSDIYDFYNQQSQSNYNDAAKRYTIVGSAHNMSPELLSTAKQSLITDSADPGKPEGYSFPSDWYSVGILLFEMLCGKWPVEYNAYDKFAIDQHAITLEAAISDLEQYLYRIESVNASLIPDCIDILKGLLRIRPEERLGGCYRMDDLLKHSLFVKLEVDWIAVDLGVTSPPDLNFNKKVGNLDVEDLYISNAIDEPLSQEQQDLFADF